MGKGPCLPNIDAILQVGFDPKTGLPLKFGSTNKCNLKEEIKMKLRVKDEQTAINRYKWFNLPNGITGQMLERMLYYRGQLAMFYMESDNSFYILPYALNGTIDVYGRFKGITPLPFNGKTDSTKAWIDGLVKYPIYDVRDTQSIDAMLNGCVLLHDYTPQLSQTIVPRQILQDGLLDNLRLSFYGIENGGAFQKKEHMLQSEQELNAGNTDLVYQDGLIIRQHFCDLVNNIWHLGIWCEECNTVQEKEMLEFAMKDSSEGKDIGTEEVESSGEEND